MKNTDSTAPARYTVESVPLPEDIRTRIIGDMTSEVTRELGKPWLSSLAVFGFMSLLVGLACYFGKLGWLAFGALELGPLGLATGIFFRSRKGYRELAKQVEVVKAARDSTRHTLQLDGPHQFVFHEHGLVILVPLGPGRTFFYDISSCADHPWDQPVSAAYEAGTLLDRWTWYELGENSWPSALVMTGEKLTPTVREDFADADELGEWVDLFGDEWMPANSIVKVDFDDLLRRDEAILARYAKNASAETKADES